MEQHIRPFLIGACAECGAVFSDVGGRIQGLVERYDFLEANGMDKQLAEETQGWDYLLDQCAVCDKRSHFIVINQL